MYAQISRQLHEHKTYGYVVGNAVMAAIRCRCGKLNCMSCGMAKFASRVSRIERNPNIKAGILSGGAKHWRL